MAEIDIVILAIVAWAAWQGWRRGLIKEIVSMAGFIVGLIIACKLYDSFGSFLAPHISQNISIGKYVSYILAFIIIWVVVPILLGVVANLITKSLKGIHLGGFNSILGLLVGVAKYLLLLSFIFCALDFLGIMNKKKKEDALFFKPVEAIVKSAFTGKHNPNCKADQDSTKVKQDSTVWIEIHHNKNGHKRK